MTRNFATPMRPRSAETADPSCHGPSEMHGTKRPRTEGHTRPKNGDSSEQRERKRTGEMMESAKSRSSVEPDSPSSSQLPSDALQCILAPMVGASELAFRLLCRNYGATLAYTPMMSSAEFADALLPHDTTKPRQLNTLPCGFQTCPQDRPLVCHFSASQPEEFARAVQAAAPYCDAIDLNLGCPQRTAFLGHFGSYLLDEKDRPHLLRIVRAGVAAGRTAKPHPVPVLCKIRLLDTLPQTIQLCRQLADAGVALIAVHARYRATWDRKGPGARDGPALLEQVKAIREALPESVAVVANGNVCEYTHVLENLEMTGADGIMSAEGLLDNPALFLPRYGPIGTAGDREVVVYAVEESSTGPNQEREDKLRKRLRSIEKVERKLEKGDEVSDKKRKKLDKKANYLGELQRLTRQSTSSDLAGTLLPKKVTLSTLYERASNKLILAREYLMLVRLFPTSMRTVIFHTRRMLKEWLTRYQLMEECLSCESVHQIDLLLTRIESYQSNPNSFVYDRVKAQQEKEAMERKKREEGKRKAYEERMIRKAKREGKSDLHFYLHIGAEVPWLDEVERLKCLDKATQLQTWKKNHSQHCMSFHLDPNGCQRARSCAFLHVPAKGCNAFDEGDEVAG